jgi:5-formyltetrahydrofolate cyclo-ligase
MARMEGPLEPALLAEVTARAKKQIRARMRHLRKSHPGRVLAQKSENLAQRLIGQLTDEESVALFWPLIDRGEVDIRPVDAALRARGCQVYYPFMDPQPDGGYRTGFRLTRTSAELADLGQGFWEPPREAKVAARGDVTAVVVPALAADGRGHRIGYGAGYYDATLRDLCPPARTIVVVYDFQLLAELPSEPHDVPCDLIVTDQREVVVEAFP